MAHLLEALEEAEQKEFLEEMISPHLHTMFVTPKDVDEHKIPELHNLRRTEHGVWRNRAADRKIVPSV